MRWKWIALTLLAIAATATAGWHNGPVPSAYASCGPGVKIDKSTVGDAMKKLEAAGYAKPHDLKKGCDNVWHAITTKNGASVRVALTPDGQIYPEQD